MKRACKILNVGRKKRTFSASLQNLELETRQKNWQYQESVFISM